MSELHYGDDRLVPYPRSSTSFKDLTIVGEPVHLAPRTVQVGAMSMDLHPQPRGSGLMDDEDDLFDQLIQEAEQLDLAAPLEDDCNR